MSKARSPREVCSTTIGTSGLIVLASFASSAGFLPTLATAALRPDGALRAPWRPQLPLLPALLAGRPQLLPGLGLLHADRLGLFDQQLQGLAVGHLLTEALQPIGLAQPVEQLVDLLSRPLGGGGQRLVELLVGGLD